MLEVKICRVETSELFFFRGASAKTECGLFANTKRSPPSTGHTIQYQRGLLFWVSISPANLFILAIFSECGINCL